MYRWCESVVGVVGRVDGVSDFFFLMMRRPPRSTQSRSSAASDVYKRQAPGFTFFNCYGSLRHTVNYTTIRVPRVDSKVMDMQQVDDYIREHIGRKLVMVGASTGSDAHTVGIDAIMNMKGYAGHYGLERYAMIEAYNLGSQVSNEELIAKAIHHSADAVLVSQTVTQKDIHIKNCTELIEMAEAEGIRNRMILVCGGPRISHELAKELGFDAGFGVNTYANDVASFVAQEFVKRRAKQ